MSHQHSPLVVQLTIVDSSIALHRSPLLLLTLAVMSLNKPMKLWLILPLLPQPLYHDFWMASLGGGLYFYKSRVSGPSMRRHVPKFCRQHHPYRIVRYQARFLCCSQGKDDRKLKDDMCLCETVEPKRLAVRMSPRSSLTRICQYIEPGRRFYLAAATLSPWYTNKRMQSTLTAARRVSQAEENMETTVVQVNHSGSTLRVCAHTWQ